MTARRIAAFAVGFALFVVGFGCLSRAQIGPIPGMGPLIFSSCKVNIGTSASNGTNTSSGAASTSMTVTGSGAIVAGNLSYVSFASNGANVVKLTGIGDQTNTVYTKGVQVDDGSGSSAEIWFFPNAAAVASPTYTFNYNSSSGAGSTRRALTGQVSGIVSTSALDKIASAATSTSTPSVTTSTLSNAGELAVGAANINATATYTESSGFTSLNSAGGTAQPLAMSTEKLSTTSAPTYAPSWNASAIAPTVLATFIGKCS